MPENEIGRLLDVEATDHDAVAAKAIEYGLSTGSSEHPNLATHDAMGLATDAALATHTTDDPDPHPIYALDTDLDTHTHTGVYEPSGTVATHAAAADPHAGYLKESDFGAPDFLVGTATGLTANEIVVGTAPGGELGGTWASPTVDASHAGGTHAAAQAAAEATAAAALVTHAGSVDPHTGYLKESNTIDFLVGTSASELAGEIVVGTSPGGELGNTWASPTVDASHSGSTHAATQAAAESTAASALSGHVAAGDPHTGYRLESANHDHSGSGLQGGTIDHGAITGLADDDHPQYALDTDLTTHAGAADPHTGYLREATTVDFLVGTATAELAGEIVVGPSPGGELGGTWATPTVDAIHAGTAHADQLASGRILTGVGETLKTPGPGDRGPGQVVTGALNVVGSVLVGVPKTPRSSFTIPPGYVHSVDGSISTGPNIQMTTERDATLVTANFNSSSRLYTPGRG